MQSNANAFTILWKHLNAHSNAFAFVNKPGCEPWPRMELSVTCPTKSALILANVGGQSILKPPAESIGWDRPTLVPLHVYLIVPIHYDKSKHPSKTK